ncbi:MAG TPA: SBBP repeat-containing protein, partial [Pyrinomonadaceae bacterium]|nr:SBBP repeat-containing protein [Pyrinomonadaceae bacterium]
GQTAAIDFPTTAGAFQTNYGGGDAFVAKLNPQGSALVYSTYLNSASGNGIAVDAAGNAYITGDAGPTTFPTTAGAFQTAPMGYDTFVTKLNSSGSALVYSARFGGNLDDFGRGIAIDGSGNAYITGWTVCRSTICTFPAINAFQPNYAGGYNDAFVTKIDSNGSSLVYSTYLGGGKILNATEDWGEAIAVDTAGSAYVTGYTYSPDFPVTSGALDTTRAGLDAFVTKFTPDGASLIYSTFIGGAGREQGQGIAVDGDGNAYVTGITESFDSPFTSAYEGFPVTGGAFQTRGSYDAFVSKLNAKGSALVYSTYLGGSAGVDRGWAIAVDDAGNACITGDTTSTNFPATGAVQPVYGGGLSDAFVTKLNASGAGLVFSTFLGGNLSDEGRGIACSGSGDVYVTGDTSSANFPTANALQVNNGGGMENHDDAFVVRIGNNVPTPSPTPTSTPSPSPTATPTPTPAPTVDTIRILRADYQRSKGLLRVDATGSDPAATLRVYVTATDALVGTLKSNGNGRFSASLSLPTYPEQITVRSSSGGSASSAVVLK